MRIAVAASAMDRALVRRKPFLLGAIVVIEHRVAELAAGTEKRARDVMIGRIHVDVPRSLRSAIGIAAAIEGFGPFEEHPDLSTAAAADHDPDGSGET